MIGSPSIVGGGEDRRLSLQEEYRQQRAQRLLDERERLKREQQQERQRYRDRLYNEGRERASMLTDAATAAAGAAAAAAAAAATTTPIEAEETDGDGSGGGGVQVFPPLRHRDDNNDDLDRRLGSIVPSDRSIAGAQQQQQFQVSVMAYTEMMHFKHVMRVIQSCTGYDTGGAADCMLRRWAGLGTFLKYYFASTMQLFVGRRSVVRVFLVHSDTDIGGKLYTIDGNRYVVSLVGNFDYWDRIGGIAAALPDIYFKLQSDRGSDVGAAAGRHQRLNFDEVSRYYDDAMDNAQRQSPQQQSSRQTPPVFYLNDQPIPIRDGGAVNSIGPTAFATETTAPASSTSTATSNRQEDDAADEFAEDLDSLNGAVMDQAITALCMVHLFEMYMHHDLKNKVPNYVTLARLFSGDQNSLNPFRIELRCR